MKIEVTVDGRTGSLKIDGSRFTYRLAEGSPIEREFSIVETAAAAFSVLVEGRAYEVFAGASNSGELRINGRSVPVAVVDPRELSSRGKDKTREGRQTIAAPMPGKVIRVLVAVGDFVEAGQGLIVVEAMKMQNEMKSPKAGAVVEIRAKVDAAVAAGDTLIVIE